MSSKSSHSQRNQAAESRLIDESQFEQRAVQIARDEGREIPSDDDRARAREELLAPNESEGDPEIAPEMGRDRAAWDESPDASGHRVENVIPEDETSVGEELVEKGLRGPRRTQLGEDPLRREG